MSENLHVIVRAAGERTADYCCAELVRQTSANSVDRVELTPFWRTLREGLERGLKSGAPWILSVDADVIPATDTVSRVTDWMSRSDDKVGVISGMIQDKLMGCIRFGGIRLYRSSIIPLVLQLMPDQGDNVRPESCAISRLVEQGWQHITLPDLVGLHDYEQYYHDIYRKAFLHIQKHGARAARFLDLWMAGAKHDDDFRAALAGAADALLWQDNIDCDASHAVYQNKATLKRLGLVEKADLVFDVQQYRKEVGGLREALDNGTISPVSPFEQEAYDYSQAEADMLRRIQNIGTNLKLLAQHSPAAQSAVIHQVRRALPDQNFLNTFSVGELSRHVLSRFRRTSK